MVLREPSTSAQSTLKQSSDRALQPIARPLPNQTQLHFNRARFAIHEFWLATGLGLLIGVIATVITSLITGLQLFG